MKPRNNTRSEFVRVARIAQRLTYDGMWFRHYLPYQFVHIPNERFQYTFLPTNRNHKPVNMLTNEFVHYPDYIQMAVVFDSDPRTFKDIWWKVDLLTLYNDSAESRFDYFERLDRLFQKHIRIFGLMPPLAHDQRPYVGRLRVRSRFDSMA